MHDTDFISDLNSSNSRQVAESRALDVGIIDGVQLAPPASTSETANRLLIFAGTAICELEADGDGEFGGPKSFGYGLIFRFARFCTSSVGNFRCARERAWQ